MLAIIKLKRRIGYIGHGLKAKGTNGKNIGKTAPSGSGFVAG